MEKVKLQKWWSPVIRFVKFIFHFIVVMLVLFIGASVFAIIEDPKSGGRKFYKIPPNFPSSFEPKFVTVKNNSNATSPTKATPLVSTDATPVINTTRTNNTDPNNLDRFVRLKVSAPAVKHSFNRSIFGKRYFKDGNATMFWSYMKMKYDININHSAHDNFLSDVYFYLDAVDQRKKAIKYEEEVTDRLSIFLKWFYFVTIATTTIGRSYVP